mmetsp:Transcript_12556/g.35920  ORF Transcript_12556/g.35920 Transcript_12556/m.35920 type:complete len:312 (+) Transcript_12556:340-1275(+)
MGSMAAARHNSFKSDPEYPSVTFANAGMLLRAFSVIGCFSRNKVRICILLFMSGRPISKVRGSLRRMAESTSYGRFVAPRTITGRDSSFRLSVVMPSHKVRNSLFMVLVALPSDESRWLRNVSISSMKITDGASLRAKLKVADTSLLLSPNHLSIMEERRTLTKVARLSLAIALASIVFPVPGCPYNKIPRGGVTRPESERNRSGRSNGSTTRSHSSVLMGSIPPTSRNVTSISVGSITSSAIAVSYSLRSRVRASCLWTASCRDSASPSPSLSSPSARSISILSNRLRASSLDGRDSCWDWIFLDSHPDR